MDEAIPPPPKPLIDLVADFFGWAYLAYGDAEILKGHERMKELFHDCIGFPQPELSSWRKAAHKNRKKRDPLKPQLTSTRKLLAVLAHDGYHPEWQKKARRVCARQKGSWESFEAVHSAQQLTWERLSNIIVPRLTDYLNELKTIELSRYDAPGVVSSIDATPFHHWTAQPPGVRRLYLSDFEAGVDFTERASEFLRGHAPTPAAAIHSAVRRPVVSEIVESSTQFDIVIVHGPIGEGTSTVLLQSAFEALKLKRCVFRVATPEALEAVGNELPREGALIVFDDAGRLAAIPSWLRNRFSDEPFGCLLLGTQTRYRKKVADLLSGVVGEKKHIAVPPVRPSEAQQFVDVIISNRVAPPNLAKGDLEKLFKSGLTIRGGLSGLWPAQYQATRGVLLDQRFGRLLSELDQNGQRALSLVVFVQFLRDHTPTHQPPSDLRTYIALLNYLDPPLNEDTIVACRHHLKELPSVLDGELRNDFSGSHASQLNNFRLEFRHPALTASLFRWCFGAARQSWGEFRFPKWQLYGAVALTVYQGNSTSAGWTAYAILLQMLSATRWDSKSGGELGRRLVDEEHPKIGDWILAAARSIRATCAADIPEGGEVSRRISLVEADALLQSGRGRSEDDILRAKEHITAALANAFDEKDYAVIRNAAALAIEISYTHEFSIDGQAAIVDWRTLIAIAERMEELRGNMRPTHSSCDYLTLLLKNKRSPKQMDELLGVIDRSQFLTNDEVWGERRLKLLRTILNLFRGRGQKLLPLCGISFGSISAIQSIYAAFWAELYRLQERNPSFALHSAFAGIKGTLIGGLVESTLRDWCSDFEGEDCWPQGVMELVKASRADPGSWLSFIRAYADFPDLKRSGARKTPATPG
ncbi:hypothetical protein [Bradyrhizobium acaciae]|uniref:P-loop NTPase n=1 Tax=Bradyrhizobium acaciae TaxID=2683706 RepID=UPI001E62F030|nr:hypothetical protein [Bradyrhizobium acaciae]MCC8977581.1 hypothetical protein [Bradyrhizobium acaciae]